MAGTRRREAPKIGAHRLLVDWVFSRVLVFLGSGDFRIRWRSFRRSKDAASRDNSGEIDPTTHTIWIGIGEENPARILLHEALHALFSFSNVADSDETAGEKRIEELEDILWALLTKNQKRALRALLPLRSKTGQASRTPPRRPRKGHRR